MSKPIWTPSAEQIQQANMTHFMQAVNQRYNTALTTYPALYQWSITQKRQFWQAVWNFCHITASTPAQQVLLNEELMPGAKWFVGSRLNYAENLLRRNDDKPAIIFYNEQGKQRELCFNELRTQVGKLASGLLKAGVREGDVVAGVLPNMPEAVIAMLASASIGAIWTACSPDYGEQAILERLKQTQPSVLFTVHTQYYQGKVHPVAEKVVRLSQQLPQLKRLVIIPYLHAEKLDHYSDSVDYETFIKEHPPYHFSQLPFDHPLVILYSSGTTGQPKCIVHGAGNTLIQHLKELVLHTNLTDKDTILYYTTCSWMMWNWMLTSLAVGATIVLYDGSAVHPSSDYLFQLIDQENISVFGTSAKYLSTLHKAGLSIKSRYTLPQLRTLLSTGSPLIEEHYDYVYSNIKSDLMLCSISGGTDIISCFALGNPILPIYRGELQCAGLGMDIAIFEGELVCRSVFPSMPLRFFNDPKGEKYQAAYFSHYPNVWAHGDYAKFTEHQGLIILGRSDATLNPGGVRIGTAEIYRQLDQFDAICDALAIGQQWQDDTRIILFVVLRENKTLDHEFTQQIKQQLRKCLSPRHVPAKIIQVADVPRTINGKLAELAVRDVVHGLPVKNKQALANPESLSEFENIAALKT